MRTESLGFTEDAVDALDGATNHLRKVLRTVARRYAMVGNEIAITPECVEKASQRVSQILLSSESSEHLANGNRESASESEAGTKRWGDEDEPYTVSHSAYDGKEDRVENDLVAMR